MMKFLQERNDIFLFILALLVSLSWYCGYTVTSARAQENETIFYVSLHGNDQWSGTISDPNQDGTNGPFATLNKARDTIRYLRKTNPTSKYTVLVRGGTYRLSENFSLSLIDSGTELNPFVIKAYENERPILSGARQVTGFTPYKSGIFKADLKGTALEAYSFRQLFAEGKRQILARFPNFDPLDPVGGGFLYVEDSVEGGSQVKFKSGLDSIHDWDATNNAEIVIYPGPNYWNNIVSISGIDKTLRIVTLKTKASYPIITGNRYFFQNLLEELDVPGEWYFDHVEKNLYYWPLNDSSLNSVSIPVLKSLVSVTGNHIIFEGFTLDGCEGNAVVINSTLNSTIAKCIIRNAGINGIEIRGGYNNAAIGNDVYEVGGVGISIWGGDRKNLTLANNRAENNNIHHIGIFSKTSSGIYCSGVGNIISHNLVYSTPRIGIYFDGNDNIIEYNHVHHVNQETQDSGIIYSCSRDWTQRGNVVRFNKLHESGGYGRNNASETWQRPFKTYGIYLDDYTSGVNVYGNIVSKTYNGAVFVHGGRDNIIENNIIVDGGKGQMFYSSISSTESDLSSMFTKISDTGYTKYPLLLNIRDAQDGSAMAGNSFLRNVVHYSSEQAVLYAIYGKFDFNTTTSDYNTIYHADLPLLVPYMATSDNLQWLKWKYSGLDKNSAMADPLISNILAGDYTIAPNSPAIKLGFKPIPFDKIGPYQDSLRASWPIGELPKPKLISVEVAK